MDSHSRAVLASAKSSFRWAMRNPFDLANLSRNVPPPSRALSFPKCLYVCGRIFLFTGPPIRARYCGIAWTLSCTTSPGNTNRDTRGTECWLRWWMRTWMLLKEPLQRLFSHDPWVVRQLSLPCPMGHTTTFPPMPHGSYDTLVAHAPWVVRQLSLPCPMGCTTTSLWLLKLLYGVVV